MTRPDPDPAVPTPPEVENASGGAVRTPETPSRFTVGHRWKSRGFDMEVVERSGNVLLVLKESGRWQGWEVAIVTPYDAFTAWGRENPPGESYPSSEQWGIKGWTYDSRVNAKRRFDSLTGRGA